MITLINKEEVIRRFEELHPEYKLEKITIRKNHISKEALVIQPRLKYGFSGSPNFYIDWLENFATVDKAVYVMWSIFIRTQNMLNEVFELAFRSYDESKNKLFVRAISIKGNEKYLEDAIYKRVLDVALVLEYLQSSTDEGMSSIKVTKGLIPDLPQDHERVIEDALDNYEKLFPTRIGTIGDMAFRMMEDGDKDFSWTYPLDQAENAFQQNDIMYILSNNKGINGAVAAFNQVVLEKIYQRLKKPFFILPSSVHEVIILVNDANVCELVQMVTEINLSKVEPKDRLTNNVYIYDGCSLKAAVKI